MCVEADVIALYAMLFNVMKSSAGWIVAQGA